MLEKAGGRFPALAKMTSVVVSENFSSTRRNSFEFSHRLSATPGSQSTAWLNLPLLAKPPSSATTQDSLVGTRGDSRQMKGKEQDAEVPV